MESNLSPVARFFGLVFAALFVVAALFAMFSFTADWQLFRPELYQNALEAQHFYTIFPNLLAEQFGGHLDAPQPKTGEQLKYLNQSDYAQIFQQLFPPDWVKAQTVSVTDHLFDYLNFNAPTLTMPVSFAEVKSRMRSDQGKQIGLKVVHTWPPCTVDQLATWTELGLTGKLEGFPVCQPPQEATNLLSPVIQFGMEQAAATLPDQIDLASSTPGLQQSAATGPSGGYRAARWFMRLSPLAALFLLALLTLAVVRNLRAWLIWWGVPLVISGGLGLILSLLAGLPIIHWLLNDMSVTVSGNLTQAFVAVIFGAVEYVARSYLVWVGIEAAVLAVIGLAMVGIYFATRHNEEIG